MQHTERAHARLSPSSAFRWIACPGSINMCDGLPPEPPTLPSIEGTAAHELCEWCLLNDYNAIDYKDKTINNIEVTDDMRRHVQLYVDYIRNKIKEIKSLDKDAELRIERKATMYKRIHPEVFGTADAQIIAPNLKQIWTFDFKYGYIPVEIQDNKQLLLYSLSDEFNWDHFKTVTTAIIQPRADHTDGSIREYSYTRDEMLGWASLIRQAAHRTDGRNTPELRAGDHCQWCPARHKCPTVAERAQSLAKVAFDSTPILPPKPEALSPLQIQNIIQAMPMLRSWLDAVESFLKSECNEGRGELYNHELINGRKGARKWMDEESVKQIIKDNDIEDAYELASPAKVEKLLGKEMFNELFSDEIKSGECSKKLSLINS